SSRANDRTDVVRILQLAKKNKGSIGSRRETLRKVVVRDDEFLWLDERDVTLMPRVTVEALRDFPRTKMRRLHARFRQLGRERVARLVGEKDLRDCARGVPNCVEHRVLSIYRCV